MLKRFHPGQRWISEGEPELGLGEVLDLSPRTVTLVFRASEETREYQIETAPLRRAAFRVGDVIKNRENETLTIDAVSERDGLLFYDCGQRQLCERSLGDTLGFSGPRERFFAGRFDPTGIFDLRLAALKHQYRRSKSHVRGFLGGRIDLLPHQLSIASEVTGRLLPRVLLADEVGLGKTIEACLILHRLLLTGRARRVLILVPESLVHQWFLELLRRFNLWFHIFDEARCQGFERNGNPFLDGQLLLCDLGLFTGNARRLQQALEAGWDMLVIDEAHHLDWSPEAISPAYTVVETLGGQTPGLLLLTATPEQLGMAGHFARLRLLDPDRFSDLAAFTREAEGYREVARLADQLRTSTRLAAPDLAALARILSESEAGLCARLAATNGANRDGLVEALIDQHGTGRVMFRNTRAVVKGFPRRRARLHPLKVQDPVCFNALAKEWVADTDPTKSYHPDFREDPRIEWLAMLLQTLEQEKVLLICHTRQKTEAIETALKQRLRVKMAVFHEGL
jgi:ATP-dependent helicase HepA